MKNLLTILSICLISINSFSQVEDCNGVIGGSSFINACGWCADPNESYGSEGFIGLFAPEFWTQYYGSGNGTII